MFSLGLAFALASTAIGQDAPDAYRACQDEMAEPYAISAARPAAGIPLGLGIETGMPAADARRKLNRAVRHELDLAPGIPFRPQARSFQQRTNGLYLSAERDSRQVRDALTSRFGEPIVIRNGVSNATSANPNVVRTFSMRWCGGPVTYFLSGTENRYSLLITPRRTD